MRYLIILILFLPSLVVADYQTRMVGTASSSATGRAGAQAWISPSNVTADDATYCNLKAKIKNGGYSEWLVCTMSGNVFSIPSGATIDGITVKMEAYDNKTGPCGDSSILIIKGGTAGGTDQKVETDDWPTTLGTKTWGSASNLWGLSWTPSDINATDFGVQISVVEVDGSFSQPYIDYVQIQVDYTPGGGGGAGQVIMINQD